MERDLQEQMITSLLLGIRHLRRAYQQCGISKRTKKHLVYIKAEKHLIKRNTEKQTSRIKRQLNQRNANWRNSSPCSSMCVDTGSRKSGGTKYQNYNMSPNFSPNFSGRI